jgi:hypothetical protein
MSREHDHNDNDLDRDDDHDHDEDEREDAALAAPSRRATGPGKRTLTAQASSAGASASAASTASKIKKMKASVRAAYVGTGKFEQRGILDHKLDAVQEMTGLLSRKNESLGSQVLVTALKIGVAAAGGALAATTAGTGILAAGLIAGAAAAATELPPLFGGDEDTLDADKFGSKYKAALREGWPRSIGRLHEQMDSLEDAKKVKKATLALRRRVETVKDNMRSELLDAWVNALKVKTQDKSTPQSMGSAPLGNSTPGRLHIEGIKIDPDGDDGPTKVDVDGLRAKLTDVPEEARQQMKNRVVKTINVARTIEGTGQAKVVGRGVIQSHFSFGIHPSEQDTPYLQSNEVTGPAKDQLARIPGAGDWKDGLMAIWNRIANRTLKSLGVSNVEN